MKRVATQCVMSILAKIFSVEGKCGPPVKFNLGFKWLTATYNNTVSGEKQSHADASMYAVKITNFTPAHVCF